MLKSKIFSIAVILIIFIGTNALFAQQDNVTKPKKTPEERAKMMTDKLNDKVMLSTDQYNSIYDLLLNTVKQNMSDRQNYTGSKDDLKKMIKDRNKETRQKIKGLLTDDQKAKLKELRKERKMQKNPYGKWNRRRHIPPYNY